MAPVDPMSKKPFLVKRAAILSAVRRFFEKKGFLEVETPLRIMAPAPELHLQCIPTGDRWLVSSPELQMKQLLASGYGPIFQISKAFRAGERGRLHNPEFTMLEWYRAEADYGALMDDAEGLIRAAALAVPGSLAIAYQDEPIDLGPTWERITVRDAFGRFAGWVPGASPDEDRFTADLVEKIEPRLGRGSPTFLLDYPASMASLARLKHDDPAVAERVELYIAGVEIANGMSELVDPVEQRQRFERDLEERRKRGLDVYPLDERFLAVLENMQPSAGCALGLDRLVMILCDAPSIDRVIAFTEEEC